MDTINHKSHKIRVLSANVNFADQTVECFCSTIVQSYLGPVSIQQHIILTEAEDLQGKPDWTNEDLRQAIANKTGLFLTDIIFVSELN
jgi:hypothetical protein